MSLDNITPQEWDNMTTPPYRIVDKAEPMCLVEKPPHYNNGDIECIDYIKQQLGEAYSEYCLGNTHKYLHRFRYKNGIEDLRKAKWYLEELIKAEVEL